MLSSAEEQIMARLAAGDRIKAVAFDRNVQPNTVREQSRDAARKLGARSVFQAVALYALQSAAESRMRPHFVSGIGDLGGD
jgi:DNA-binding NarL/FixJ family response regulator